MLFKSVTVEALYGPVHLSCFRYAPSDPGSFHAQTTVCSVALAFGGSEALESSPVAYLARHLLSVVADGLFVNAVAPILSSEPIDETEGVCHMSHSVLLFFNLSISSSNAQDCAFPRGMQVAGNTP